MKSALVDVPVKVNIWIREECQKRQFEIIKQARPSILFLQSDGGRNDKEWSAIYNNRKIFDTEIDWECQVYKFYEDYNNGMYAMGRKVQTFIWEHVDRCIFLEDDYLPSVSYFRFCAEMLELYKDDYRVHYVTGYNYKGIYDEPDCDYFFCGEGSIWGCATWRRVQENRNLDYKYSSYSLKKSLKLQGFKKRGMKS